MSAGHNRMQRRAWRDIRLRMFERDGWKCRRCDRGGRLECDHVTPLEQGGAALDPANLQTLCRRCHIAKTTRERCPLSNHPAAVAGRAEWAAEVARAFG